MRGGGAAGGSGRCQPGGAVLDNAKGRCVPQGLYISRQCAYGLGGLQMAACTKKI